MTANAMLIRSKIKRPGGSTITMSDGTNIKFTPDENGDHVAMVSNRDHIGRLLSISEGYEIHFKDNDTVTEVGIPVLSAPPLAVVQTGAEPVVSDVSGTTPIVETTNTDLPADTTDLNSLTDEQLKAVYRAEWNKDPHPKAKRETIIAQIDARREEAKAK